MEWYPLLVLDGVESKWAGELSEAARRTSGEAGRRDVAKDLLGLLHCLPGCLSRWPAKEREHNALTAVCCLHWQGRRRKCTCRMAELEAC